MDVQKDLMSRALLFSEKNHRDNGILYAKHKEQVSFTQALEARIAEQETIIATLRRQIAAKDKAQTDINTKVDGLLADFRQYRSSQVNAQQVIADFKKDVFSPALQALSEKVNFVSESAKLATSALADVRAQQNTHNQSLLSHAKRIEELDIAKAATDQYVWGLKNRITNLSTELAELRGQTNDVSNVVINLESDLQKLNKFVEDSEQRIEKVIETIRVVTTCETKSEQAMAIARSVQNSQTQLIEEIARRERVMLNCKFAVANGLFDSERHHALVASSNQPPQQKSINDFESRENQQGETMVADSQATMSQVEDEAVAAPNATPAIVLTPAKVVQQKARMLVIPELKPTRQPRSATRGLCATMQTREAKGRLSNVLTRSARARTADSAQQPLPAQIHDTAIPKELRWTLGSGNRPSQRKPKGKGDETKKTQSLETIPSSIPSMSSLLAEDNHKALPDAGPHIRSSSTTAPVLANASKKRRMDSTTIDPVDTKLHAARLQEQTAPPRSEAAPSAMPEKLVSTLANQHGLNEQQAMPKRTYKQNRRINIDDW